MHLHALAEGTSRSTVAISVETIPYMFLTVEIECGTLEYIIGFVPFLAGLLLALPLKFKPAPTAVGPWLTQQ